MNRVKELESMVMNNLLADVPIWTGNSARHITALGIGHIRLAAPVYDKEVARNLVNKLGKGQVKRLSYSEKYPYIEAKVIERQRYTIKVYKKANKKGGTKDLFDYAWLLNEFGAWGGRKTNYRHRHWANRAVYNACVMYAFINNGEVKMSAGFFPY